MANTTTTNKAQATAKTTTAKATTAKKPAASAAKKASAANSKAKATATKKAAASATKKATTTATKKPSATTSKAATPNTKKPVAIAKSNKPAIAANTATKATATTDSKATAKADKAKTSRKSLNYAPVDTFEELKAVKPDGKQGELMRRMLNGGITLDDIKKPEKDGGLGISTPYTYFYKGLKRDGYGVQVQDDKYHLVLPADAKGIKWQPTQAEKDAAKAKAKADKAAKAKADKAAQTTPADNKVTTNDQAAA